MPQTSTEPREAQYYTDGLEHPANLFSLRKTELLMPYLMLVYVSWHFVTLMSRQNAGLHQGCSSSRQPPAGVNIGSVI